MTSITVIKPKLHDSSNPKARKLDYLYEKYSDAYDDYGYYLDKFINDGGYPNNVEISKDEMEEAYEEYEEEYERSLMTEEEREKAETVDPFTKREISPKLHFDNHPERGYLNRLYNDYLEKHKGYEIQIDRYFNHKESFEDTVTSKDNIFYAIRFYHHVHNRDWDKKEARKNMTEIVDKPKLHDSSNPEARKLDKLYEEVYDEYEDIDFCSREFKKNRYVDCCD